MGSLGAALGNSPPMNSMVEVAGKMKIWALVAGLGGTFSFIEAFEYGLIGGHPGQLLQQFIFLCSAFAGAHIGYLIITYLAGGR